MRKLNITILAGLCAVILAAPAASAVTNTHRRTAHGATATVEAVAGQTKTRAAADDVVARLTKMGFKGFVVETDTGRFPFEVERRFSTFKAAQSEHMALHRAGFRFAFVERG